MPKFNLLLFLSLFGVLLVSGMMPESTLYAQSSIISTDRLDRAIALYDQSKMDEAENLFRRIASSQCGPEGQPEVCFEANYHLMIIARLAGELERAHEASDRMGRVIANKLTDEPFFRARFLMQKLYLSIQVSDTNTSSALADSLRSMAENPELNPHARAISHNAVGFYEDDAGNYETAITYYQNAGDLVRSLEKTNPIKLLLIQIYNNMGVAYRQMGNFESSKEQYETSLELIYDLYGEEHREIATTFNNLGSIYYSKGDIGRAAEYFLRSAEMYQSLFGDSHTNVGAALNNVAASYYALENYELAAEYLEKAQRVKEANLGTDHPETAVGYSNLASMQMQNGNYETARANYELSISIRERIYGDEHPFLIDPKIQLGTLYAMHLEEGEEARKHYSGALRIARDRLGETHPTVSQIHIHLGTSYLNDGKFNRAELHFNRSFRILYGQEEPSAPQEEMQRITNPSQMVNLLKKKARLYREMPSIDSVVQKRKAVRSLEWAANLVDEMQHSFKHEASKLHLIDQNYSIYTDVVDLYHEIYLETGEEDYLERIFSMMEKSRARIALELLQNLNAQTYAGVPDDILEEESELNSEITELQQALFREQESGLEADSVRILDLKEAVFNKKRELDQFTMELEQDFPSYYSLKYDQSVIDLEQAREMLDPGETLLAFMLGADDAYAFVLNEERTEIVNLGPSDEIESVAKKLTDTVLAVNKEEFVNASYLLYQLILEPVEQHIRGEKLLVMADQSLHYAPLEMLLPEQTQPDLPFYQMPFLLRDYAISYIPSMTVFHEMDKRRNGDPRNLLAIAPFTEETIEEDYVADMAYEGSATPLLLTRYETRSISEIFRERRTWKEYLRPQQAEVLTGSNATMSRFTSLDHSGYNFLHFATHAFINEEDPEYSGMLLHPDDSDNGVAYVSDIYNMEFNADLVVLGACQTGLGSTVRGEGVIGFTRAFIYAGASNLAVSMWRVSDQPTAHLMIEFYNQIRQGKSYSEALRQAKLYMIEKPQYANPVNWAAFVLNGR